MKTLCLFVALIVFSPIEAQELLDSTLARLDRQIVALIATVKKLSAENQTIAAQAEEATIPIGTILAFGGPQSQIPSGYLFCNGDKQEVNKYPKLAQALAKSWGGSGAYFYLPDLRGEFLRGWDENADNDPDKLARTSKHGGKSGNNVGSYQEDKFQSHSHPLEKDKNVIEYYEKNPPDGTSNNVPAKWHSDRFKSTETGYHVGESGGSETRPKNAAVLYIIKAD